MADAGVRRHGLEVREGALAPAEEGVALAVAPELELGVALDREPRREVVDLHRVVDHELDRDQRVDLLRVAAEVGHRRAHRGQVDDRRDAGEVLQQDARRVVADLLRRLGCGIPAGDRLDVARRDGDAVLAPQHVLEQDAQGVGEPGDVVAGLQRSRARKISSSRPPTESVERAPKESGWAMALDCRGGDAPRPCDRSAVAETARRVPSDRAQSELLESRGVPLGECRARSAHSRARVPRPSSSARRGSRQSHAIRGRATRVAATRRSSASTRRMAPDRRSRIAAVSGSSAIAVARVGSSRSTRMVAHVAQASARCCVARSRSRRELGDGCGSDLGPTEVVALVARSHERWSVWSALSSPPNSAASASDRPRRPLGNAAANASSPDPDPAPRARCL